MKISNDPINALLEVFSNLYNECDKVSIWYSDSSTIRYLSDNFSDGNNDKGVVLFPDDKDGNIVIYLNIELPVNEIPVVLIHQLSHIIAGKNSGHSDVYCNVYSALAENYLSYLKKKDELIE